MKFNTEESIDFTNFKESLWNKVIKKSQPNREQCFMDIAFQRAVKGQFFIIPHNISIADSLVQDNILAKVLYKRCMIVLRSLVKIKYKQT